MNKMVPSSRVVENVSLTNYNKSFIEKTRIKKFCRTELIAEVKSGDRTHYKTEVLNSNSFSLPQVAIFLLEHDRGPD